MLKKLVCSVAKLFVFMLHIQLVASQSQLPSDQVSAMTRIYEIIQNDTAVWNNVLKNSNSCSWKGVICSPDNSSINHISFTSFSISTSKFLPFLCNINTLESLDVSNNELSSIPDAFYTGCGNISGLKLLNFSGNKFIGSLPTFNGFRMLEILDFSVNSLSGNISLQLDGLGSLKSLHISKNNFNGSIPTNLGKLNLLEELLLSGNSFTGEIPVEITKCKNLKVIDFSGNGLSGSIPVELGELIRLETLVLSSNKLSGSIPTSLSNITTLKRFAAYQNNFFGTIPPGITLYLRILDLSYNNLTGAVPSDLLSGPNLQSLDLSFNELEGPIPAMNSTTLLRLRLSSNYFNGTIPSNSLGSLVELMYLQLDNNRLTGEIPLELGMCKKLALLNLAQNKLTGTLPPVLGALTNLEVLSLELNNFVGEIPQEISQLNRLLKLNMNGNSLNGPITSLVSNLSSLMEVQLGSNQLSGPIPDLPISLEIALNLSYNKFSGPIPVSLNDLGRLLVLDLSNNGLTGNVPFKQDSLQSLTHFLLSNNELSGSIPIFPSYVVVDISGNNNLIDPRNNPSPASKRKTVLIDSDFVIAVEIGWPVGVLITMIGIFISRRYDRIHGHLSPANSRHRLSIDFKKAMEAVADPSNITLKARLSTFYKAVMPSGTTYLVKKVNHSSMIFQFPRHKELVEELDVYGNLSNSNVMIPIAYILTASRAYIFYEFVRGTLSDILHHRTGSTLDWASRYNIAVGVAQGLAYLHECSSGPIILLDLCSRSILLKSMDEPQISDIELCSLIHPSETGGILGSVGYVPPEYGSTERVTAAGNVYSFGVVLLELVTGKPAVSGGMELAKWALSSSMLLNKGGEILDSSISETSVSVRNQMVAVLGVALACINTSPEMRPNTITVLQMLLRRRLL
ncbi:hypothetical protein C2S51_018432 [Perilla frutescens var. frutescens]|nr:hypothetical protein C2S51_018432 [Perilla frutescens var. frutescens]